VTSLTLLFIKIKSRAGYSRSLISLRRIALWFNAFNPISAIVIPIMGERGFIWHGGKKPYHGINTDDRDQEVVLIWEG